MALRHAQFAMPRQFLNGPRSRDPAIYTESGSLPAWAEGDARAFWDAADLYERANGRLYISADFALPSDFDEGEWWSLPGRS